MVNRLWSRRRLLGLLAKAGLGAPVLGMQLARGAESFRFAVMNDLHFTDAECGPWLEAMVRAMKRHAPEFCVLVGDLAENGTEGQLRAVNDMFSRHGIPLHPVIGNHDFAPGDNRAGYDAVFPHRLNYAFAHNRWQFVALDSTEGEKVYRTEISAEALTWVHRYLRKADRARPLVVFTHFPIGPGVTMRPLNADLLLEQLHGFRVPAIFSGHWHAYSERTVGETLLLTNRCAALRRPNHDGSPEKGFVLCEARGEHLHRTSIVVRRA